MIGILKNLGKKFSSPIPKKVTYSLALASIVSNAYLFYTATRTLSPNNTVYHIMLYSASELLGLTVFLLKPFKLIPGFATDLILLSTGSIGLGVKFRELFNLLSLSNSQNSPWLQDLILFGLPGLSNLNNVREVGSVKIKIEVDRVNSLSQIV